MSFSTEEEFILNAIRENGVDGKFEYKQLQDLCANQFEGVRLILKKLKEKGLVDFEGSVPGLKSLINLLE